MLRRRCILLFLGKVFCRYLQNLFGSQPLLVSLCFCLVSVLMTCPLPQPPHPSSVGACISGIAGYKIEKYKAILPEIAFVSSSVKTGTDAMNTD